MFRYYIIGIMLAASVMPSFGQTDTLRVVSGRRVASAVTSLAVTAGLTEVLKHSVHEMRPDRSDNSSFPSRHTSWAFAASSVLSRELRGYSPWWSVSAQAAATGVGLQRVMSGRHYGSDVVAGAALGVASTELSYCLVGLMYGNRNRVSLCENEFGASISSGTEALYFMNGELCTGFGMTVRGSLPFSGRFGAVVTLRGSSEPVRSGGVLKAFGVTAGVGGHFMLPVRCLAVEPAVEAGMSRLGGAPGFRKARSGFDGEMSMAINWRLTANFAVRAGVGYHVFTVPEACQALVVSVASVVFIR